MYNTERETASQINAKMQAELQMKEACRPSLRESLHSTLHRTQMQNRDGDRASRLLSLLEKNPELFEILDLLGIRMN